MSFTALNWAWEQTCPSGVAKSVLVYLANCASQEGGECYPSIRTICRCVQHHDAAVRKALKDLVAADMLEITEQSAENGRRRSNLYRLPVTSLAPTPAKSRGYPKAPTPAKSQGSGLWHFPPEPSDDDAPAYPREFAGVDPSEIEGVDPGEIETPTPANSQGGTLPDSQGGTPANSRGNPSLDTESKNQQETHTHLTESVAARDRGAAPPRVNVREDSVPRSIDPPGWQEWIAEYPTCNQARPGRARLSYAQAIRDGAKPEQLLTALRGYRFRPGQYTILPENWLRDRCWEAKVEEGYDPSDDGKRSAWEQNCAALGGLTFLKDVRLVNGKASVVLNGDDEPDDPNAYVSQAERLRRALA